MDLVCYTGSSIRPADVSALTLAKRGVEPGGRCSPLLSAKGEPVSCPPACRAQKGWYERGLPKFPPVDRFGHADSRSSGESRSGAVARRGLDPAATLVRPACYRDYHQGVAIQIQVEARSRTPVIEPCVSSASAHGNRVGVRSPTVASSADNGPTPRSVGASSM